MMQIDFVSLNDVFDEVSKFIEQHREEIEKDVLKSELLIDYETFKEVAQSGQAMTVILRHEQKIVGFSAFYLSRNPRNVKEFEATNHGVFVEKEFRRKYGLRILEDADKFLARLGVIEISYINDNDAFGRLLSKIGYKVKFKIWSKKNG